jgi:hypothetical protein
MCEEPVTLVQVSFPTRVTYADELSVTVTLRNHASTEQSRRIKLYGESHGVPISLTQATVYVSGNATVEHELTASAAPAGLSELFIANTEYSSSITITPIQATVGDHIPLADGTIIHPTTVEQTDDATALYIDIPEHGRNGPPERFQFTEQTEDALAPDLGEFTRLCSTWDPLYEHSDTGGWLIFLPQTQQVLLREEGTQARISLIK